MLYIKFMSHTYHTFSKFNFLIPLGNIVGSDFIGSLMNFFSGTNLGRSLGVKMYTFQNFHLGNFNLGSFNIGKNDGCWFL